MKKLLLMLMLLVAMPLAAKTYIYKAIAFAAYEYNEYTNRWVTVKPWTETDIDISISDNIVTIHGIYYDDVYKCYGRLEFKDINTKEDNVSVKAVDEDGDEYLIGFTILGDGTSMLSIFYSDENVIHYRIVKQ